MQSTIAGACMKLFDLGWYWYHVYERDRQSDSNDKPLSLSLSALLAHALYTAILSLFENKKSTLIALYINNST